MFCKYIAPIVLGLLLALVSTQVSWANLETVCAVDCDYTGIRDGINGINATGDSLEIRADTVGGTKIYSEVNPVFGNAAALEDVVIYVREGDTVYWDSESAGGHYQVNAGTSAQVNWKFDGLNLIDSSQANGTAGFLLLDGESWTFANCSFSGLDVAIRSYGDATGLLTVTDCTFLDTSLSPNNEVYIDTSIDISVLVEGCTFTETANMASRLALCTHEAVTSANSVTYYNNTFNSTDTQLETAYVHLLDEMANVTFDSNHFYAGMETLNPCIRYTPGSATDQIVNFNAVNNYFHEMGDAQNGIALEIYKSGSTTRAIAEWNQDISVTGNTFEGFGANTGTNIAFSFYECDGVTFSNNKVSDLFGPSGAMVRITGIRNMVIEGNLGIEMDNHVLIHGEEAADIESTISAAHIDNIVVQYNWFRGDASDGAINIDCNDGTEAPDVAVNSSNGLWLDNNVYEDCDLIANIWHYTEAQTVTNVEDLAEFITVLQDTSTPVVNTVPDRLPYNSSLAAGVDKSIPLRALLGGSGTQIMGSFRR